MISRLTFSLAFLLLYIPLSSCDEDDIPTTGGAMLVFSGTDLQDVRINIYPETVYEIPSLLRVQPLIEGLNPISGEINVANLNAGNYTWYDLRDNIGFFQITAGETRSFEYSLN